MRVLEHTNIRELQPDRIGGRVDLVVADLSFISLTLVLPALARCAHPHADHVLLVKPQFELGPDAVGSSGIVRGVAPSVLPGVSGNVESFVWLQGEEVRT